MAFLEKVYTCVWVHVWLCIIQETKKNILLEYLRETVFSFTFNLRQKTLAKKIVCNKFFQFWD